MQEFHRVLRAGGKANIMVYNSNSLWKHLYVPYKLQILDQRLTGLNLDDAFTRSTDGESCPIALNYDEETFGNLGRSAGFSVTYKGGFFCQMELDLYEEYLQAAVNDERMPEESRRFLQAIQTDRRGFPTYHGRHAGVGGVFLLEKRA